METLIHADIFFFITTLAVILVSAVLVWGGLYAVRIMRDIKDITKIARDETERVADDIEGFRTSIFSRFFNKVSKKRKVNKTQHAKKETE